MHKVVEIDTRKISDWDSFHDVFKESMGFPDFYGRNMSAWIDCMTSLDEPDDALTSMHVPRGSIFVLKLMDAKEMSLRCPDIYDAFVESSAFVNYRRMEVGEDPILALAF